MARVIVTGTGQAQPSGGVLGEELGVDELVLLRVLTTTQSSTQAPVPLFLLPFLKNGLFDINGA